MADSGKVRLKDADWESLFPGTEYTIASTTFRIKPLSLKGLAFISTKFSQIGAKIGALSFSISDLDSESRNITSITELISTVLEEAPEVLSEMTGLHEEDIKSLPLDVVVDMFNVALDVNLNSQEDLVKNLKSLGEKFNRFLGTETKPEPTPAIDPARARLLVN
jgi:hypothetical protein